MSVELGSNGKLLQPNHIYILPSGEEMEIADGHLRLRPRSKNWGYSNVLSIFLNSLSKSRHPGIAVILSGMDADGASALQAFRSHGGTTIVQDIQSSENPGMPLRALTTGCVDYMLLPEDIAPLLEEISKQTEHETEPEGDLSSNTSN